MAIPIAKRPLFPGFYKAVTIKDANVVAAIHEMLRRGQPYVGAFLFKDEAMDKDIIEKPEDVYDVGVFAQITSVIPQPGDENTVTAVLYPHRRIKMTSLLPPGSTDAATTAPTITIDVIPAGEEKPAEEKPQTDGTTENKGDVVASFEEPNKQEQTDVAVYEPTAFLRKFPVSLVNVKNMPEVPYDKKSANVKALASELVNVFREIASINPMFKDQISDFSMSYPGNVTEEPSKLADFAAAVSTGDIEELQDILQTMDLEQRLHKSFTVLKNELMNAKLQSKITKDVENKIQKRQREYWLMEQMKGIKRELGLESDGKDKLVEKFKEKQSKLAMPEAVSKVFDEELNKLQHLEPAASEFNVTRNYLDWLTQIPWGQRSAENFGIKNAMTVLDEDHYGLKDVKDRILEFIAVGKLRGTVEGKILCFVGPPGVGKTSIGKSIARALNRQYYRFSVGGLTDVAEIKGHRRTYVGALPGRVIQALKKCQTENPLILIDEVDKIGRGHQGDPSSALLELLDPEQNSSFLDHYMDVPVDLSKVLFVCTANMTDTIPRPLLDRMEVIELSGYVADEKKAIADRYLAPQAKELSGLKTVDVTLDESAIETLINKYCRESGVRNLKKQIEKVYRKSALKIIQDLGEDALPESEALTEAGKTAMAESVKNEAETADPKDTPENIAAETTEEPRKPMQLQVPDSVHVKITSDNLADYVGPPIFKSDRLYETTPPGVVMGLAWTSMGGTALYVESILESALSANSRAGFERTGNLKPVMKESSTIAYSFAKSVLATRFPENKFFDHAKIHLHCPEGAVPKDGPSAGITMSTALLSLAMGKEVSPKLAMTGELTVTGKVLRIGGLREKTVAARRAGCETILFPKENQGDWDELPAVSCISHPASA
jgi:ATP-dependent Lon protease